MGLTTVTAAAVLAFNAFMASAQVYTCECDGLDAPVWDDCDTIVSTLDASPMWYRAPSDQLPCGFVDPPAGTDPDSLNCVVSYCKRDGVARGEDILYSDILLWYTSLTSNCKSTPGEPGGKCGPTGPVTSDRKVTVHAQANPHYSGGSRRRNAEPLVPVNETLVLAEPPKSEREHARDFPHDISKRETPPDSDDRFELFVTSKNVQNPYGGRIKVFGPSPSGSTYTVSSSHSETNSVSSSASLSAGFFEVFEASVSIDVGYEETTSETEGFSVTIDCPSGQRGVIDWVPLYNSYSGLYQPSGTQVEWYVANGGPQTSYSTQCVGQ